jgi:4-hydroxy-tetrahydrodipicolinate synthase
MFCAGVGLRDSAERKRFLEVAVDEAQGQIMVSSGGGGGGSLEAAIANLQELQGLGLSHVMFSLPSGSEFETADAVYEYSRRVIESTDLGIVLYAQSGERFKRFHPGNVPLDIFSRLADLPNVIGAKLTQVLDPVMTYECCERLGEKLLLGPVNLELAPLMARLCPIQYTAMWQVDACQSPEKPYVNDFLHLLSGKQFEEATAVYWQMQPLLKLFWDEQAEVLRHGGHPWAHLKYHTWAVGGNGGPLRRPAPGGHNDFPDLTPADRQRIRETYRQCGIEPSENETEFDVGRSSYTRGERPS